VHQGLGHFPIVFDRAISAGSKDRDGRLHVRAANISRASISSYFGYEIPSANVMGLDPNRAYRLLRDSEELRKAAPSFNSLPVLSQHATVSARNHYPAIGITRRAAKFVAPFLQNSLVVWSEAAITAIDDGTACELSAAYHFTIDMTPGVFEVQRYDGVMRNIAGNHVAIVKRGRAGSECALGGVLGASHQLDRIINGVTP
jgi:hypothetical protein